MYREEIIKECLKSKKLKNKSDVTEFICEVLKLTKTEYLFKNNFSNEEVQTIFKVLSEYEKGKPVAKIINNANFYGLDFFVNYDVLTPRQDSELIVFLADKIIKNNKNNRVKVLDLCTGTGCIGLTIKYLNPNIELTLADISKKALSVAHINSESLQIECDIIQSDLFDDIIGEYDIIVSNPPYIRSVDIDTLENEVKNYDPLIALDGLNDGLAFYKRIEKDVLTHLKKSGILICEFGFDQAEDVKKIFENKFKNIEIYKDDGGNDRAIVCKN